MAKQKMAISQSMMKDLQAYLYEDKECGLLLKARYVDGIEDQPSDAMLMGQCFEYWATGQLPRNGKVPEPKVVYKGKPNEKLAEPFQRAFQSAEYCKVMLKTLGIKILKTGDKVTYDKASGTSDIFAEWNGRKCIIDLKYSGLLDNKWDERGWALETLETKDKLLIQAVHYTYIYENLYNEPIDFYFFLFSSTNPNDVRIVKVEIDNLKKELHVSDLERAYNIWNKLLRTDGFKAKGSLSKCASCPLKDTCKEVVLLPKIHTIYY